MTKLYRYPDPDEIQINESALREKFREFGEAMKNNASLQDLFIIVPAWVPIFFSTFNGFRGIPGAALKAGYATFIALGTIVWIARLVASAYKKVFIDKKPWMESAIDPRKMIDSIRRECMDNGRPLERLPRLINRENSSIATSQRNK